MRPLLRVVLAFIVCALFGGLVWLACGKGLPARTPAPEIAVLSASDCRKCHAEVWTQWENSPHARAWSDPNVQAAFQHFGHDRKCQSCHAPRPVLAAGLASPPEARAEKQEDGVDCLSCHQLADGAGVAARRTLPDAPCRPVATPELIDSRLCGACHEPIFKDWQASRYAVEGKPCVGCHMVAAGPAGGAPSHLCPGSREPAWVRSSSRMDCRVERDEVVVSVTNHAAGHNFPGERHHRVLLVQILERDAADQIVLARQEIIKGISPLRGETSADRIRAGQTHEVRFPIVQRPITADVRLLYKNFPWYSDRDALVVHQAELKVE